MIRGDAIDDGESGAAVIHWLEEMGDAASRGPQALLECMTNKPSFQAEALVEYLLLSGMLKNDKLMRGAIVSSLRLTLPAALRGLVDMVGSREYAIPSQSTSSRHRLSLDVALCQLVQQHFTQLLNGGTDFYLWAMADSSYRGQRE